MTTSEIRLFGFNDLEVKLAVVWALGLAIGMLFTGTLQIFGCVLALTSALFLTLL